MKYIICLITAFLMIGCTVKSSESNASKAIENLTYKKADNGLCFGVSNTFSSAGVLNTIIVNVPCDKVGL